jgi:hypothetical protein
MLLIRRVIEVVELNQESGCRARRQDGPGWHLESTVGDTMAASDDDSIVLLSLVSACPAWTREGGMGGEFRFDVELQEGERLPVSKKGASLSAFVQTMIEDAGEPVVGCACAAWFR